MLTFKQMRKAARYELMRNVESRSPRFRKAVVDAFLKRSEAAKRGWKTRRRNTRKNNHKRG